MFMNSLEVLVHAATLAPSGDNTQPWDFEICPKTNLLTIRVNKSRDPSPMNAGQRMARMAIGAAVENIRRTAEYNGWMLETRINGGENWVQIRNLTQTAEIMEGKVPDLLRSRVTNRRFYDSQPLSPDLYHALRTLPQSSNGSVETFWVVDTTTRDRLARIIGRADAAMFGQRIIRQAFNENIRFDCPVSAEVEEGLSLGSLELSRAAALGLKFFAYMPDRLLRLVGGSQAFSRHANRLVTSSSGLCIGTVNYTSPDVEIFSGQDMQSCWLDLTSRGLAAQPMMSLPILSNFLEFGLPILGKEFRCQAETALSEFRRVVGGTFSSKPVFILRFGYGNNPTGRCGRLPPRITQDNKDARHF